MNSSLYYHQTKLYQTLLFMRNMKSHLTTGGLWAILLTWSRSTFVTFTSLSKAFITPVLWFRKKFKGKPLKSNTCTLYVSNHYLPLVRGMHGPSFKINLNHLHLTNLAFSLFCYIISPWRQIWPFIWKKNGNPFNQGQFGTSLVEFGHLQEFQEKN